MNQISRRDLLRALSLVAVSPFSVRAQSIPDHILGVELTTLKGWHANIYPWTYDPGWSTVHPVPALWDPPKWDEREQRYISQYQSWAQIVRQSRQLEKYGSVADVLEFNVAPGNPDYNHWLRTYLGDNSDRPFYVLYEHIHGNSNYVEFNGEHNMDLYQNKKAFVDDIEFFLNNIVLPNKHRYVTVNGRAIIYLWAPSGMTGDFATLLRAVKLKYPIFFIGSVGLAGGLPEDPQVLRTLDALDGYMDYGTPVFDKDENGIVKPDNYKTMTERYAANSKEWRKKIGNKLFIPIFQAAYDDTKIPDRNGGSFMYPRTREEMERNAEVIKRGMTEIDKDLGRTVYDSNALFGVYSEIPEGGALIEAQCLPETIDRPGRFVGCGTQRLEIISQVFRKPGGGRSQ